MKMITRLLMLLTVLGLVACSVPVQPSGTGLSRAR